MASGFLPTFLRTIPQSYKDQICDRICENPVFPAFCETWDRVSDVITTFLKGSSRAALFQRYTAQNTCCLQKKQKHLSRNLQCFDVATVCHNFL